AEVCASTPSGELDPYSQEYEGYMGNYGNTLDRWYHRAAVVIWPRDRAFANRAEASPAWALDELAGMASSGDVAGARTVAATLGSFWRGVWTDDVLFGKALRAADLIEDAATAAMLLRPFRIGSLNSVHACPFARIADRYGHEWTAELLRSSFGEDERHQGPDAQGWVADSLLDLCRELVAIGGVSGVSAVAAQQLVELAWRRIGRSVRSAFAVSPPSHRDSQLKDLGRPLAA